MKTNLLLLNRNFLLCATFTFSSLIGVSQNVNIPDANFKNFLVNDRNINTNRDNEIQIAEAAAFKGSLEINGLNMSNLIGIEAFTALISLACGANQLTSLNVSGNIGLIELYCESNKLTSLIVSGANKALTRVHCQFNQLTSLNVSANTALTGLRCFNNQLTSLNVSTNSALTDLRVFNNQLTSLNVKNGNNTKLLVFAAFNNPNLTCIQVDNVAWSTAAWTVGSGPNNIDATASFSTNCSILGLDKQNTLSFTIYPNPFNEQLFVELTDYKNTIAEIFNLQGQLLQSIPLQSSKTTIQISNLTSGSYLFKVKSPEGTIVKKIVKN